jgi:hypothetical protein
MARILYFELQVYVARDRRVCASIIDASLLYPRKLTFVAVLVGIFTVGFVCLAFWLLRSLLARYVFLLSAFFLLL